MPRQFRKKFLGYSVVAIAAAIVVFAMGVALPLDHYALPPADMRPMAIDDVSIMDLEAGVAVPGQTIVVHAGRISYAGSSAGATIPAGARRVSGKGKFAIPGLWDMHVHTFRLSPQVHFPLLIANGVTSVRNMGDGCSFGGDIACQPHAEQWNKRDPLTPRLFATASYHVEEVEAGIVAALVKRGDKMLKLQLEHDASPAVFNGLVREGRQAGMQVAGHLPHSIDLLDPATEPLHSIEHDTSLLPQCSAQAPLFDGRTRSKIAVLQRADPQRCAAVLAVMAKKGVGYVPTHIASSGQDFYLLSDSYKQYGHLQYVAWSQRMMWRLYAAVNAAGTGDDDSASLRAWYDGALKLTGQAHASGVAVMAGSDAMDAYVSHGFGLHDELAQLVSAGLTPRDALRAATVVPARHAGMDKDYGSIKAGKIADIVLLSKNPLLDIAHTETIDSVVFDGRLHEREQLDGMLAFARTQAASFSLNCKFLWGMIKP